MTNALLWLIAFGLLLIRFDLRRIARNQRNAQLRTEALFTKLIAAVNRLPRSTR